MRWRSVPREALIWRQLDSELVVRNARSGSTHLLELPESRVLLALVDANEAMTAAELAGQLDEEEPASIEAVLAEFQRLGLAEPRAD